MDGDFQRRQVVTQPCGLWKLQHAGEHRGHELTMGHPVFLNEFEIPFRIETLHDDDCAARADREIDGDLRGCVVEWRR